MRKLLPFGVIALLVHTSCASALAQSATGGATNDQQTSSIIAYVINMDGQRLPVSMGDIQQSVKAAQTSTPQGDTSGKLSKDQIKQLAKDVGLLTETKTNPHLSFLDGDIAYWEEQKLSLTRLRLEFAARKAVLDAADKAKVIIDDQGKLSWASQKIMANVLKEKATQSTKGPGTQK
jgi:hypothetical protein